MVFVYSGGILLRDCTISLKSMPNHLKTKIPAVVALPYSFVNFSKTEVIGNETSHTAGMILINADAMISECKFTNFNAGAIYSLAKPTSCVKLMDLKIQDCKVVGIYI